MSFVAVSIRVHRSYCLQCRLCTCSTRSSRQSTPRQSWDGFGNATALVGASRSLQPCTAEDGIERASSRRQATIRNSIESTSPYSSPTAPHTCSARMATGNALPDSRDLGATWSFLEEGVDHIMTRLSEGMSYAKYMYV